MRARRRFRSPRQARRFLEPFEPIRAYFRPRRRLPAAGNYGKILRERFAASDEITGIVA